MATERPGANEGAVPQGAHGRLSRSPHELRSRINQGVYRLGARLPTQNVLAAEFKVSRDTIQRAMRELQSEQWIKTTQGSGSEVIREVARAQQIHNPPPPDGPSEPEGFESILATAFQGQEVTLDAFCLTTESLADHFGVLARRLADRQNGGESDTLQRSVTMRLLLPSADPRPVFPSAADPEDSRPYERWAAMVDLHVARLRETLAALRRMGFVSEAPIEVRRVPLTPTHKLYLFNNVTALHGLYPLERRMMPLEGDEEVAALDVLGLQSRLFRYEKTTDKTSQGSLFVDSARSWFNSYWDHLGVPFGAVPERSE